ncbi:hypothetical protein Hanom_Chr12g01104631 [Helianthus anomalus]
MKSVIYPKRNYIFAAIFSFILLFSSKLPFWSLWFGQFCHFSPNLKLITSRALWFGFCCHFGPNFKFDQILLLKPFYFVFILRGILGIL